MKQQKILLYFKQNYGYKLFYICNLDTYIQRTIRKGVNKRKRKYKESEKQSLKI